MQPTNDDALLRQYVTNQSDEAFATLVTQHVNLVYSVALRQVGNPHHAEEITQAVFIILAKKAATLRHHHAVSSWLFQVTRLTANNFIRSETRRHRREEEAYMQSVLDETGTQLWMKIAPLLDTAVAGLREQDRRAIVLRFYEGRSLREVGMALGASEDAAEKRVNRALEKLRKFFAKRGVSSTTAIIAGTISANSVQAAPVALAKTVTAVAIAKGAVASGSTLTLIKGALKIMAWTKAKTAIVVGVVVLLATGTTTVVVRHTKQTPSANSIIDDSYFNPWKFQTAPINVVIVRPTHFTDSPSRAQGGQRMVGHNVSLLDVIEFGYGESPAKIILPIDTTKNRYDFLITVPDHQWEQFQAEIKHSLGFVGRHETRETDALVLKLKTPGASGLKISDGTRSQVTHKDGAFIFSNQPVSELARYLTGGLNTLVIDQSGLTNRYDYTVEWTDRDGKLDQDAVKKGILDSLGLELVSGKSSVEMLVVEKVK
jgi:uncharacterized protein (TIGR03435 family)